MTISHTLIFPHAGGSRAAFHFLPGSCSVLDYPGHGTHIALPPMRSLPALARWCTEAADVASVWFGHSLGCYVALATLELRRSHGLPLPHCMVLSAALPPALLGPRLDAMALDGAALLRTLVVAGDVPAEIAADREFATYLQALLEADFALAREFADQWDARRVAAAVDGIGVVLVAASADPTAPAQTMSGWHSCCRVEALREVSGSHHYFAGPDGAAQLLAILAQLHADESCHV